MSDDEGSPRGGRISLQRGRRKSYKDHGSTNWVMFAGGAIAMAVSVAFGRKKASEETVTAESEYEAAAAAPPPQAEDESAVLQTSDAIQSPLPLDKRESPTAEPENFEFRSLKTKRPAPTDSSLPASKCCKQSSIDVEATNNTVQVSLALQSGAIARRSDRLRQQIKSRDVMIYEMQAQLLDQDQMITMHRNHAADLRDCVQAISTKLFEANLEIQRLQRELMAHCAKPIVDLDEEFIDYAVSEFSRQWVHPKYVPMQKGVGEIILEAKKLNEEVELLRREQEAKDSVAQAKARQCELLSKRLSTLTIELEDVKAAAQGKQRLLELKEQEYLKLANVVQDLQRKLEIEAREESQARSCKLTRWTGVHDHVTLSNYVDRPRITPFTTLPTRTSYSAGNLRKPVPLRNQ